MLKAGFVLLYTVYTAGVPDNPPPTFFGNKEACEAVLLEIKHRAAMKRKQTADGVCLPMADPNVRRYLEEELRIRQR